MQPLSATTHPAHAQQKCWSHPSPHCQLSEQNDAMVPTHSHRRGSPRSPFPPLHRRGERGDYGMSCTYAPHVSVRHQHDRGSRLLLSVSLSLLKYLSFYLRTL